jgi:hypothetical protein
MEILPWLFKWIAGPIAGIIVTLLFSEPLRERLAPVVLKLGSKKDEGVAGRWVATFYYGQPEVTYVEVIEVSTLLGYVVGRIIPHPLNQGAAKRTERTKPLRVKGTVKDNRFFTGVWLHPERLSHHRGAFDLIIRQTNVNMEGMWLGYSESKNVVETGRWEWRRVT